MIYKKGNISFSTNLYKNKENSFLIMKLLSLLSALSFNYERKNCKAKSHIDSSLGTLFKKIFNIFL